jgi:hypothetical protein
MGILAAGLMQMSTPSPSASTAWADDAHDRQYDHDHYNDHHGDHDSDHDGHPHGNNTRDCGAIHERIRYDNERVHQIDPAKHPKARQWYKDDINNARNDLRSCRG